MFHTIRFALLVIATSLTSSAYASKVRVWHHSTPSHHEKAIFRGAVMNSEGALRLARQLEPFAELDATHVWCVVEDKHGNLLVATGDNGKVYRIATDGKVSVALQTDDSQVFCLVQASDGTVYAGTGPNGRIFRIPADEVGGLYYQSPESYIWCLAVDPNNGDIYAGTGPQGRIYQLSGDGRAKVLCDTKQGHVLCMTIGPDGDLYAGTDRNGLVYRLDSKGKSFVLYHAPQSEVRCLFAGAHAIYAGTSAPRRRDIGSRPVADKLTVGGVPAVLTSNGRASVQNAGGEPQSGNSGTPTSEPKEEPKKGTSAPTTPPPAPGENSVYRIAPDGTGREVFRETALILSLAPCGPRLFVGTGTEGQLYEVDERTKDSCEIARLDHGQVQCMCRRADGSVVLGTGDPGRLYVLKDKYAAKGTVLSGVLDGKLISKWGSLRWQAEAPVGTRVSVAVRSGNLSEPDETWSDWSAEQLDPENSTAHAPAARYLQYRITLDTDDTELTPAVRSVSVRYQTANQAPEISAVEAPNLDAVNLDNAKRLRFKWTASDPNEDELTYRLHIRKDGWNDWVLLEDALEKREYEWDTTTAPAGMYQLKVVASDRKDNAEEDALTGERVSATFPVAHMPPTVNVKTVEVNGNRATVEAAASDPLVRLTAASFAVDGKPWINVFPSDGLFDRKTADFRFTTDKLEPGTHVLVLRVRDAAGNTGTADAVFTVGQ